MLGGLGFTSAVAGEQSHSVAKGRHTREHNSSRASRRSRRRLRRRQKHSSKASVSPSLPDASVVAKEVYVSMRCDIVVEEKSSNSSSTTRRKAPPPRVQRVVLVNWENQTILDVSTVEQEEKVNASCSTTLLAQRPPYPGRPPQRASLGQIRAYLAAFLQDKVLIGHSLDYVLYCLGLQHAWVNIRDCATYPPFMEERVDPLTVMLLPRPLEDLSKNFLNHRHREEGAEGIASTKSSKSERLAEEAAACMELYKSCRTAWEEEVQANFQQKERQRSMKQWGLLISNNASIPEQEDYAAENVPPLAVTSPLFYSSQSSRSSSSNNSNSISFVGQTRTPRHLLARSPLPAKHDISSPKTVAPTEDYSTAQACYTDTTVTSSGVFDVWTDTSSSSTAWMAASTTASNASDLWSLAGEETCCSSSNATTLQQQQQQQTSTWGKGTGLWLLHPCQQSMRESRVFGVGDDVNGVGEDWLDNNERVDGEGHLPSRLLNDSSDEEHDREVDGARQEEDGHPVDENFIIDDWLEDEGDTSQVPLADQWSRQDEEDADPPREESFHPFDESCAEDWLDEEGKASLAPAQQWFSRPDEREDDDPPREESSHPVDKSATDDWLEEGDLSRSHSQQWFRRRRRP